MNLVLYQNKTAVNRSTRNLTQIASITGHLREGCNILNPDIRLEYNSAYLAANYAYIPEFNRYYYFREAPTIVGKVMMLHLHVDVLYTYRSLIMAAPCIAERSSSNFDLMLPDDAYAEEAGYYYHSLSLPYTFRPDRGIYVLSTTGGF